MTQYTKPAVRAAWAETATPSDIQDPGNSYVSAGWQIGIKPPRQYENWQDNYCSAGIRYLCQNGIAAYDPAETYYVQNLVNNLADGCLYRAIQGGGITGISPQSTGPDQIHWDVPYVPQAPNGDATIRIANTAFVAANYIPKGAAFNAIAGQVSNGQVPLSAVQQYQGNLSIAFSQLAGTIFNSQVPFGAVQQWQANLAINWGQLTGTKIADSVQGFIPGPFAGYSANTLARYDSSGYLYALYYSQASENSENPSVGQFMVTNGVDNFLRKADVATVRAALAPPSSINGSNAWWMQHLNGLIEQWGKVSLTANQGNVFIPFPVAFSAQNQGVHYSIEAPSGVGGAGSYENYITSESLNGFNMSLIAASGTSITVNWNVKGR